MPYQAPDSIAIVNKSRSVDEREVQFWIEAYRREIAKVAASWGLEMPGIEFYPAGHKEEPDRAVAALYIVDTANEPDALGYHTVVGRSRFGYVDMDLSKAYDIPSVVFGHELYEMFVDADCDRWVGPIGDSHYAVEVCDPCQRDYYKVDVSMFGLTSVVSVADFILPAWFQPGAQAPYSYLGGITRPLTDAPGGYHLVERNGVILAKGGATFKSFGRTFRRMTETGPKLVA